ncbi:MAG: putative toxin-antitoxin system toxin component, PIN family [Chitinispirillia bacterium]|nr:putative toxin-antitoxin system toxin component, PIN family [Chitinispirillia bacterium]MCL2268389.1 putative toxin-antitoxin system toxin component, PIN family [Chitinispirillia bacterium]
MKIVVDANIFVSAYVHGKRLRAFTTRYATGPDQLFISDDIIAEIKRVLRKPKFKLNEEQIAFIVSDIEKHGENVAILPQHKATGISRDPNDDMYLECAVAANVDYIVSGDSDLCDLKEYKGIPIVLANDYLKIVNASV